MALTIDQLQIQIEAESTTATSAIDTLIGRLESLHGKLNVLGSAGKSAGKGLQETANGANKAATATNKQAKSTEKAGKSTKKFTDRLAQQISKTRTLVGAFKTLANSFGNAFNESNDYIETLNLFNVTMGEAAPAAFEYAKAVEAAMGIDSKDFMQFQGVFKNLTAGFGVVEEDANKMSQNLTQLSYDMASIFNTDVETAFDKLSSAMSGQVKGLREFGIDTSVATLEEYALSKGIDASVRSMSQAEKAMLRYNFIMEKSIHMQGDMARTIVTPANALRILQAQLTRMKRAFGDIISVIATQVIPYVQAFVEIVTEAATAIATFFGFDPTDYTEGTEGIKNSWAGAGDEVDNYTDSLKKAKKQMMGFDELNIIQNPTTDSGAGGDAGGGGAGNMPVYEYDFLKGLKTDKVDEIKEKMKGILEDAHLIAAALLGWTIGKLIKEIVFADGGLAGLKEKLSKGLTGFGIVISATITAVGIGLLIEDINKALKGGITFPTLGELLLDSGITIGGAAMLGGFIGKAFGNSFGASAATGMQWALGGTGLSLFLTGMHDWIENGPTWANVITTVAGAVMMLTAAIWGGVGAKIADAAQTLYLIGLYAKDFIVSVAKGTAELVKQAAQWALLTGAKAWDAITTGVVTAAQAVWNALCVVGTAVTTALGAAFTFLTSPIGLVVLAIAAVIAIVVLCIKHWDEIKAAAAKCWEGIKNVWSVVSTWFKEKIIQPVGKFFVGMWDGLKNGAKNAWEGIKNVFSTVGTFFKNVFSNAWKGVVSVFSTAGEIFVDIKDGIVSVFKTVVNGIIKGINAVVKLPFQGLNKILDKIHGLEIAGVKPFNFLTWRAPIPEIPLLASGGIVNEGQMFVARERGPELVGSIGRKTAVANNDQIISGIESGVYRAMMAANSGNSSKPVTVNTTFEIDGEVVGKKVIKYHNGVVMQTGASPLLV